MEPDPDSELYHFTAFSLLKQKDTNCMFSYFCTFNCDQMRWTTLPNFLV